MKRGLAALAVVIVLAAAVYVLFIRDTSSTTTPPAAPARPVAQIGEGSGAIIISGQGTVLPTSPAQKGAHEHKGNGAELPRLPLKGPPKGGQVGGPVLEQVHVLAAAPKALRPYLKETGYRKEQGGVEVETTAGIELRFGDDSKAKKKWEDAAAILADPSITTLDYVDLQAPAKPAYGGEGHELPPAP